MKIAIFASGTGSNFEAIAQAIEEGRLHASIDLVVVDKLDAPVIEKAERRGIDVFSFNPKNYTSKAEYELEIIRRCKEKGIQFIVLAGYMRLVSTVLLKEYEGNMINIHPSLLPKFKGKRAIEQAVEAKEKEIGVSIHYVNELMDDGAIIASESFDVESDDTLETITEKVHRIEHRLYPQVIAQLLEERK